MDEAQVSALRSRISPRLVVGLLVILLGALVTLDNLGFVVLHALWRFWPIALVLIGLTRWIQGDAFGAFLWMAGGIAFLAVSFELLELRQLWGLLLVAGGARLVFGPPSRRADPGASPAQTGDAATLSAFAMLGGVTRGTNSTAFRSGTATAFMGGCVVDLRQAKMAGAEATFDSFAVWGGVEIKVPADWAVENRGLAVLGGFVDSTRRPSEPRSRLLLTGLAIMGGVEVKN